MQFRSAISGFIPLFVSLFLFVNLVPIFNYPFHSCFARSLESREEQSTGAGVYNKARDVFNQADGVHYQHNKAETAGQVVFDGGHCRAECDCSGFVCYVLGAVAPRQYLPLAEMHGKSHPQAKTFVEFFQTLNSSQSQGGWLAVTSYTDLRQGDLIAWAKPVNPDAVATTQKGNTGHVMIVEAPPAQPESFKQNDETIHFVSVPVIDSSSVDHFPPEQLPPRAHQEHRDGLGRGCIRLILNGQGKVIGYWEGTYWGEGGKKITRPTFTDSIVFARLVHCEP